MSEFAPSVLSFRDLIRNKNLLYLTTLESDPRLETLLEKGRHSTEFAFSGASRFTIHPIVLPKNHIASNGEDTQFTGVGYFDSVNRRKSNSQEIIRNQAFFIHLKSDASQTLSDCIVQQGEEGLITVSSKEYPTFLETMTLEKFAHFSLCAADLEPDYIYQDFSLDDTPQTFDTVDDIAELWKETALANEGHYSTERKACQSINSNPETPAEIRIVERLTELPDRTRKDITIEHVTRLHALDAQIIYHLEMTYESITFEEQSVDARKHVVSGSEQVLTNAQLSCVGTAGRVTPLDVNDAVIMKQFKTAVESVLQKSQTSLPTLG